MSDRNIIYNVSDSEAPIVSGSSNRSNKFIKLFILFILFVLFVFVIIVIIFAFKYYLAKCDNKYSFYDYLKKFKINNVCKNIADTQEVCDIPTDEVCDEHIYNNEVFHISDQVYTYDQAQCKCAVYGAKLATHKQIIDAYNKGGNWCSYGWSDGDGKSNAYYITQQSTIDKLQKGPEKHHNDCGKIGVNGGYFQNKNLQFGANCYGIKPTNDNYIPTNDNSNPVGFCDLPQNVNSAYKLNNENIAPFNTSKWSINS